MSDPDHEPITLDRRRDRRERLLLRAKIVVGDSVHDCILLDQTAGGARIETLLPLNLPERFSLRFPDGRQLACERRWINGRRVGVMVLRPNAGASGSLEHRAGNMLHAYEAMGVERFFDQLRSENYLRNSRLGEAAWQAEAAIRRLGLVLKELVDGQAEAGSTGIRREEARPGSKG